MIYEQNARIKPDSDPVFCFSQVLSSDPAVLPVFSGAPESIQAMDRPD